MYRVVNFKNRIEVPALGQGTWNIGDNPQNKKEELKTLRTGIDLGMTVIDTAEMYGEGRSERLVGEAIFGIRNKVFLITKVLPLHANLKGTKMACEKSLKRLKTDYLDLYLLHWRGRYPFEETVQAMIELQQEGKIKQWGVSNMDISEMKELYTIPGGNTCATNEVLYNLVRRGIEYDLLSWCEQNHLPIIAYSPIEQGRLLNSPPLIKIANKYSATPVQIALAWILRKPNIIAIPKASTVRHVEENFSSLQIILSKDDLKILDDTFPAPVKKKSLEVI